MLLLYACPGSLETEVGGRKGANRIISSPVTDDGGVSYLTFRREDVRSWPTEIPQPAEFQALLPPFRVSARILPWFSPAHLKEGERMDTGVMFVILACVGAGFLIVASAHTLLNR